MKELANLHRSPPRTGPLPMLQRMWPTFCADNTNRESFIFIRRLHHTFTLTFDSTISKGEQNAARYQRYDTNQSNSVTMPILIVPGVLIECDPSIKSIIVNIDSDNHDFIIEDLDEERVVVKENMVPLLKQKLEDVSSFLFAVAWTHTHLSNSASRRTYRLWRNLDPNSRQQHMSNDTNYDQFKSRKIASLALFILSIFIQLQLGEGGLGLGDAAHQCLGEILSLNCHRVPGLGVV